MAQMVQEIGEVGPSGDGGDRSDVGRKAHDNPLRISSLVTSLKYFLYKIVNALHCLFI